MINYSALTYSTFLLLVLMSYPISEYLKLREELNKKNDLVDSGSLNDNIVNSSSSNNSNKAEDSKNTDPKNQPKENEEVYKSVIQKISKLIYLT